MHTGQHGVGTRVRRGIRDADGIERALWALVVLSLIGDIVTTFAGLHLGLTESNPVARTAIEGWGVVGMLALKALAVGVALCCRPLLPPAYRPVVPAGLALPWAFAVVVNCYMITSTL